MAKPTTNQVMQTAGSIILPLALAQFICSYAGSSMNVAISNIAADLNTTVAGVQVAITLFTLVMAALMIPGSILTDIWGRKFCLVLGLGIYAAGALIAAVSPNLFILIIGNSILEGVGSALLIPPVYILVTVFFTNLTARAKNYGRISAAAGIGAAAGPLIGGFITTALSWRANFVAQALVIGLIILLARKIDDPKVAGAKPKLDLEGAILSAAGLVFIVVGILLASTYGWFKAKQDFVVFGYTLISQGNLSPVWLFIAIGAGFLYWFYYHISKVEKAGGEPLLSPKIFDNKTSNAGLVTQLVQWLTIQGSFFAISVFLQSVKGLSAVATGLALTPATIGILLSSALSGRLAKRQPQAILIRRGFLVTMAGMLLLLLFGNGAASIWAFAPGLLVMGLGIGVMLTSSVNVVQSSFSEKDQGEISGLSRSVSNLGSSLGVAMVGSVLAATLVGTKDFLLAVLVILVADAIGLWAALRIPRIIQPMPDN